MNPDQCLDARYELRYKAEYSARYHRRRAAFLGNLDTLLTLITIMAGAAAFGDLVAGSPSWLAKIGAAVVTLISLGQAILRLAPQAAAHTQWLKRWAALFAEQTLTTEPNPTDIKRWLQETVAIEAECVGELRALVYDCEDAAARALGISDRQHKIHRLQRMFIHFGTWQQIFPPAPDIRSASPLEE